MRPTTLRAALVAAVLLAAATPQAWAVGTLAGTNITNQATVNYTDTNSNALQALSNVVTTTVSQVASVTVAPDNASNAAPGDVVYYAHVVTNGGNGDDTIDMTAASSNGWAYAFFLDNDGSGTFTPGDTAMTDTDGDLVPDIGLQIHDATVNILVSVTVPAGTANGTVDTLTVTGTSTFNNAVFESAIDTTTIDAPDLAVTKAVAPLGDQPPGATLTYTITITNNGGANALSVVMTDPIPANTTYVGGSITLGGAPKTDVSGDDEADYNVTNPGMITVSVGSLAPAASVTITFSVTIN